jgi:hypothetical protein
VPQQGRKNGTGIGPILLDGFRASFQLLKIDHVEFATVIVSDQPCYGCHDVWLFSGRRTRPHLV